MDYLLLSCEAMERVKMLTSSEQSRSTLHLNQALCRLLAEALSEAIQSAKQDIDGLDPSSVLLFGPAFRELCRVAGDCEKLVRDCCNKNWLPVTILLADSKQDFELRASELKWCTRAWRIVKEHGLQGGAWLAQFYKSSQPSVADRSRDMYGDTARALEGAFEEDLRTLRAKLTEIQGNLDFGEEMREFAGYILRRCEMIDGVRPGYEQAGSMYELPGTAGTGIQFGKCLGGGAFGSVFEVTWLQEYFASKCFADNDLFLKEVDVMIKMGSHPRIVGFLGTVGPPNRHRNAILMELMYLSNLDYLRRRQLQVREGRSSSGDGPLPLHVAVDIMLQVAEGVEVFHKVGLFHRDLKSGNIPSQPVEVPVLREEGYVRVKLADFGVTQTKRTFDSKHAVGTRRYMAPEVRSSGFTNSSASDDKPLVYPAKADAYSFAIVCYEILTGKEPFPEILPPSLLAENVLGGGLPELPASLPPRLTSLLKKCLDKEPTKRPSFPAICKELRYLKFLLTIGGEEQFRALDGPDEAAELTAEIVKQLRWIDHHELHLIRHLGSGGYGAVDECEWRGQQVAVKNLLRCPTKKRVEEEAALLVRVEHPNVVKLIGCTFNEEEEKGMLVMELMDQDLHHLIGQYMRSRNAPPFSLSVALEIMLNVATAMKHIRSCNVSHRDLKTTNILVKARIDQKPVTDAETYYDVKFADFGLSKYKSGDSIFTTRAPEAQFWRAPETSEARNYSWPADVFSLGVVCYEILSGERPFEGMLQGPELLKRVRDGERPEIPSY